MNDKERRIVEERTNEAYKKNLIGWNGKIGVVLRHLGEPIIGQSQGMTNDGGRSANMLEDYYDSGYDIPEDYIETMEMLDANGDPIESPYDGGFSEAKSRLHYNIDNIGYYFQLMQNKLNLEMKFMIETKEMIVNYQGNLVFREKMGELSCFVPSKEWEEPLDKLYKKALKKEKLEKEEAQVVRDKKVKKEKENWLKDMAKFWGI